MVGRPRRGDRIAEGWSRTGVPWDDYESDYRTIRGDIARVIPGCERFEERVLQPGTSCCHTHDGTDASSRRRQRRHGSLSKPFTRRQSGGLILQSLRSHDQFNTTIYGFDDRDGGVTGGRPVVFVNPDDLDRLGLREGSLVDIIGGSPERVATTFRVVRYPTPPGCATVYYPEANMLTQIDDGSLAAGTPSFKSILVTLRSTRPEPLRSQRNPHGNDVGGEPTVSSDESSFLPSPVGRLDAGLVSLPGLQVVSL